MTILNDKSAIFHEMTMLNGKKTKFCHAKITICSCQKEDRSSSAGAVAFPRSH